MRSAHWHRSLVGKASARQAVDLCSNPTECQIFHLFCCFLSSLLPLRSVGRSNFDKGLHSLITLIQKRHKIMIEMKLLYYIYIYIYLGETMLDANSAFQNIRAPTLQDPSTGGFSPPDVTVVRDSLINCTTWRRVTHYILKTNLSQSLSTYQLIS